MFVIFICHLPIRYLWNQKRLAILWQFYLFKHRRHVICVFCLYFVSIRNSNSLPSLDRRLGGCDETRDWVHENEMRFWQNFINRQTKFMTGKIVWRCIL